MDFPHFWRLFGGKDCGLCPYNSPVKKVGELEVFLYDAAENFELFSSIQDSNKKNKNLSVDVFFKAYPMVPFSGRSDVAGRYL